MRTWNAAAEGRRIASRGRGLAEPVPRARCRRPAREHDSGRVEVAGHVRTGLRARRHGRPHATRTPHIQDAPRSRRDDPRCRTLEREQHGVCESREVRLRRRPDDPARPDTRPHPERRTRQLRSERPERRRHRPEAAGDRTLLLRPQSRQACRPSRGRRGAARRAAPRGTDRLVTGDARPPAPGAARKSERERRARDRAALVHRRRDERSRPHRIADPRAATRRLSLDAADLARGSAARRRRIARDSRPTCRCRLRAIPARFA